MKFPVLSIIVPMYNAQHQLERFFHSIENQDFSGKEIEILMVDGGSTDRSVAIAKVHHTKVINNEKKLAEPGVALGIQNAKAPLVMVLATDNIFKDKNALKNIVNVFQDKNIIAALPKHDTAPDDSIYSRYFNTFTDPYTHFIYGKASNARTFRELYTTTEHTSLYDIYDYDSNPVFPLIALAQGFTVKKSCLKGRQEQYDDVLVVYDIIKQKKHIAYVYGVSLYHYTISGLTQFIKKQRRAVENALLRGNSGISIRHRYLTPWQKMKQCLFFPYSLSVILPIIVGIAQWIRTGESMWLIHPYMVFISAVILLDEACRILSKRLFFPTGRKP